MLAICTLLGFSTTAQAQQKIGHIDSEAVIANMPEYISAKSELETYSKTLEKELEETQKTVQTYYTEVMQKVQKGVLTPKEQKEEEANLQQKQQALQKQASEADQKIAEKEGELTKPIFDKFNAALEKAAKANDFSYIIDIKIAIYSSGGIDATSLVKAELGIE